MDASLEDGPLVALGSSVLALIEVIPVINEKSKLQEVALSSPFVKRRLHILSRRYQLGIRWDDDTARRTDGGGEQDNQGSKKEPGGRMNQLQRGLLYVKEQQQQQQHQKDDHGRSTISFSSEDPLEFKPIPCIVIAHAISEQKKRPSTSAAVVLDGTLVRVLPPSSNSNDQVSDNPSSSIHPASSASLLHQLVGEAPCSPLSKALCEEIVQNHDPKTVQELQLRMSLLLAEPVRIGTTEDAMRQQERRQRSRNHMASAIQTYMSCQPRRGMKKEAPKHPQSSQHRQGLPSMLRDGGLLVHSPDHAAGKTTLVRYIAQERLQCQAIHVIQPAALLAKYGSQADSGLESTLHAIVASAAVAGHNICIILDHLEGFLPPAVSATSGAGDAAVPVLHAMQALLQSIILSLKHGRRDFPFPTKNMLYNVGGKGGYILAVKLCLVAIVTCPDHGWRSSRPNGTAVGILNALPMGTYRLPSLTAATRIVAFEKAIEREQVMLADEDAREQLKALAVAALWARGRQFTLVAQRVVQQQRQQIASAQAATAEHLQHAFDFYARGKTGGTQLVTRQTSSRSDPFSSVGGTGSAKKALIDALALDDSKKALLQSMGLDSPIGVLLYGPPGCGKTLLAKAVASFLGADNKQLGGAFIPLNSSDIVQAAVGESEKLIVNAFVAARENAPSVIFIDEFQALFMERSSSGSSKLSSTLLQCMDDVKQWRNANKAATVESSKTVVVLGATNTPWMLDKSFLRPGRFDRIIHVGLPSQSDRESILSVHIGRMRIEGGNDAVPAISKRVSENTEGYSGADLAALCRAAAIRALVEKCDCVVETHFLREIEKRPGGSSNSQLVLRNRSWRP